MLARRLLLAGICYLAAMAAWADEHSMPLNDAGLHIQSWFHDSQLDLGADIRDAAIQEKDLMILYERRGCVYCAQLHAKNFVKTEMIDLFENEFLVVQLDLFGSRQVVDFDGQVLSEDDLATKWGVGFTPTTLVFAGENAFVGSQVAAETFRLPGYLEAFQYYSALDYFATGAYQNQGFQAFMAAKAADFIEQGIDPALW